MSKCYYVDVQQFCCTNTAVEPHLQGQSGLESGLVVRAVSNFTLEIRGEGREGKEEREGEGRGEGRGGEGRGGKGGERGEGKGGEGGMGR